MQHLSLRGHVRIDIPDEDDPDFEWHGEHGVIYYDDSFAVDKLIKGGEKIANAMTSQQIANIGLNQNQIIYLPDG